jgi:hypothetical protein
VADTKCYLCRFGEEHPNYKAEFEAVRNAPSDKWYYIWHFPRTLWEESKDESVVCKCCETKFPAEELGEYVEGMFQPFIAQCPLIRTCRDAAAYWGQAGDEPMAALKLFKAQRAERKVFPKPTVVIGFDPAAEAELEAEGDFNDEDYIDMRKPPVLKRSK